MKSETLVESHFFHEGSPAALRENSAHRPFGGLNPGAFPADKIFTSLF